MECPVCLNPFNNSLVIPLVIPCGHSICAVCINAIYKSSNRFCPLDRIELPAQDTVRPNYALIESTQSMVGNQDLLLCCNGHVLDELVSVKSRCRVCKKEKSPLWFCIPCQSGACDKCKVWYTGSQGVKVPGIKCYNGHSLRLTQNPANFYNRNGKFLCDGCREKDAGASAHCRKCNVDYCTKCLGKVTELISVSLHLKCICKNQIVWRAQEVCGKCNMCKNRFEKCGSFICVKCSKRYCLNCTHKNFSAS